MTIACTAFLFLSTLTHAVAQDLILPEKIDVRTGRLASIDIISKGKSTTWTILPPGELDVFREYDADPAVIKLRLLPYQDGRYYLVVATATAEGKLVQKTCVITAGKPPDPKPQPGGAPLPAYSGFRVLMVYESGALHSLPATQVAVLNSTEIMNYLNAQCPPGPDGKTPEWRKFDKDVDLQGAGTFWQEAMKRPRTGLPWLLINNADRNTGFEGPLPMTIAETLKLLEQHGPGEGVAR